jgi:hypothetical protein
MHLNPSIEIALALGSISILTTFPYVLYRFPSARVTKPLIIHLLAYAMLTPLTWIGMTGSLALTGAWFGFLPPDPSALIYSAIASILPASALTAGSLNPPPP